VSTGFASAVEYAVQGSLEEAAEWVGREVVMTAPFCVEAGRIADFCSLVEDANPHYWDLDVATARYGG